MDVLVVKRGLSHLVEMLVQTDERGGITRGSGKRTESLSII